MEINDAYDYLIHLIACAIHNEVPKSLPDGVTYEQVLSCAIRHDVAGFAYLGVLKGLQKPDQETMGKWHQRYLLGIQRHSEQEETRKKLLEALHLQGIATLELQGTRVKRYYPTPDLRMMSDIDILIQKKDIPASEKVLQALGYQTVNQNGYEIDGYSGKQNIEIHSDFFPEGFSYGKILNEPFRDAVIQDDLTAEVPDTVFWSYHLLHCLKHYFGPGIGLRRVLDLHFLKDEMEKTADMESVNTMLSENGFSDTVKTLFAIADDWFGEKGRNGLYEEVVSKIKCAGTHGNLSILIDNEYKGKKFQKIRYFLSLVFPKKEKIYQSYPYCKEHNYPYVLAWFHRAIRIPFKPGRMKLLGKYIRNICKAGKSE